MLIVVLVFIWSGIVKRMELHLAHLVGFSSRLFILVLERLRMLGYKQFLQPSLVFQCLVKLVLSEKRHLGLPGVPGVVSGAVWHRVF